MTLYRRLHRNPVYQTGAVLLVMLLVISLVSASLLLGKLNDRPYPLERDLLSIKALADAKIALLSRAVTDDNRPGSLPCPDLDGDGSADLFAGAQCPGYVGRLPWRSLKIAPSRDGAMEILWYALSPSLRDHPAAEPINSATHGQLSVDGQTNIAALIFAPGIALSDQARPSNAVTDYLEGKNADGDRDFSSASSPNFSGNDLVLAISQTELMSKVELRVIQIAKAAFALTYPLSNPLPFAAAVNGVCKDGLQQGFLPLITMQGTSVPPGCVRSIATPASDCDHTYLSFPTTQFDAHDPSAAQWFWCNRWGEHVVYNRHAGGNFSIGGHQYRIENPWGE